jgi:uncharacterized protein DUF6519
MKGDFTRQTFDSTRHFTTVRMQQGRVQLDADWNEQADLALHRDETETADVVGGCGGPLDGAAFGIVLDPGDAGDFELTPGRYYVDGILCESEHAVRYTEQPDLPGLDPIDVSQTGFTIVYLDVWQRHLTWLDDARLRETALGGPDTATRTKTVWQVRSVFVGESATTCVDEPQAYLDAIAASSGLLSARAKREDPSADPCIVPASAGYRGLENQLYRVEIHAPGEAYDIQAGPGDQAITLSGPDQVVHAGPASWTVGQSVEVFRSAPGSDPMEGWVATVVARDTGTKTLTLSRSLPDLGPSDVPRMRPVEATFKWSRDNGSVVTLVSSVTDREVVVTSLGPDESSFKPGQWVELVDELTELDGRPGFLVEIEQVDRPSRTVTLRVEPPAFSGEVVKLRRWDGVGAVKTNPPGTAAPFLELEDGVQVSFSDGTYKTGDHWLIPARTATADERSGTIEWPVEGDDPLALPPLGIRHHYCKIAVLESNGTTLEVEDCRSLFPPLTELATLVYVGGDGQEARPGEPLPRLLEAGVFQGRHPVEGATVRFTADAGGKLAAELASVSSGTVTFKKDTGPDGIAACAWLPANDLAKLSQQVEARLLDAGGNPLAPQLDYNAQLSVAAEVAYVPGECADLASATTVQEALDILCKRPTGGSCCIVVEPGTQLEEVLKKLIDEGVRDMCLCLKPGDYALGDLELTREVLSTLAIEGCGAGARLKVGGFQLVGLDEVRLRGLDLLLTREAALGFHRCAEVAVEDCKIARAEAPGPVCQIGGARRIRIADSVLDGHVGVSDAHIDDLRDLIGLPSFEFAARAGVMADELIADAEARNALATKISRARRTERLSPGEKQAYELVVATLRDAVDAHGIVAAFERLRAAASFAFAGPTLVLLDGGAEALIDATDIAGALVLYGLPPGEQPDEELLKQVRAALGDGRLVLRGGGSLHLRELRMSKVMVGRPLLEQLTTVLPDGGRISADVFRALHVAGTEVLVNGNVALAGHATLDRVDFPGQESDVGAFIGDSAIVTACRAPNDFRLFVAANDLETAANLRINVVQL